MPDKATHIAQARHNEAFRNTIDSSVYSDWAVTVIFYQALQYVDALLAEEGNTHPGGHDVRDNEINARPKLRPIARFYFRLKSRSRNARYHAARFHVAEVERCQNEDLRRIRDCILSQIA
jgi:hypothetical protein